MPERNSTADILKNADENKASAGGESRPKIQSKGRHLIECQSVFQKISEHPETAGRRLAILEFKVLDTTSDDVVVGEEYGWKGNLDRRFGKDDYPDRNRYKKLLSVLYNEIYPAERPKSFEKFLNAIDDDSECVAGLTCVAQTVTKPGKNGDYTLYNFHSSDTWEDGDGDDDGRDDEDDED